MSYPNQAFTNIVNPHRQFTIIWTLSDETSSYFIALVSNVCHFLTTAWFGLWSMIVASLLVLTCFFDGLLFGPGLEVIKLEFILRLKIKRNDWLLADTYPQAANHCALFCVWDCTQVLWARGLLIGTANEADTGLVLHLPTRLWGYNFISCPSQLSMKFQSPINLKCRYTKNVKTVTMLSNSRCCIHRANKVKMPTILSCS